MKPTGDQHILNQVIQKAWEEESFKKQLIENPVQTLERVTGRPLSLKGRKLVVLDQTDPTIFFLNIPVKIIEMDDAELTEDQLDHISGGDDGSLFPPTHGNG